MIRVVFFGTPNFALPVFEALLKADDIDVVGVVTQPDKPSGRGHEMTPSPVKVVGARHAVRVLQFPSLKKPEVVEALKKLEADAFVVFSYGKMIPASVLSIPRLGCLNVHPSLLPLYRGPTPVPAAILRGDTKTGVSIMLLDEGMDTGPILAQAVVNVLPNDTTPILMHRLIAEVGSPLLVETLRRFASGQIKPQPQDNARATICGLHDREDGFIKGNESSDEIDRKIRAYFPWPGCYTIVKHNGKDLRVKLLPRGQVQPDGKKPMALSEFERGYGRLFSR